MRQAKYSTEVQQRPLTVASQHDRQHTKLAGTTAKRPAALVRDERAAVPAACRSSGKRSALDLAATGSLRLPARPDQVEAGRLSAGHLRREGWSGRDRAAVWTASHDQRQCSLCTVSFTVAIAVCLQPRCGLSARSEARTNSLDGSQSIGGQLGLPTGVAKKVQPSQKVTGFAWGQLRCRTAPIDSERLPGDAHAGSACIAGHRSFLITRHRSSGAEVRRPGCRRRQLPRL